MDSLIFAVNAVAPIVFIVAIGYALGRIGVVSESFAKTANKLVFHLFLPCLLFLNIYKIDSLKEIELGYMLYVFLALVIIFAVSIPLVVWLTPDHRRRGAMIQAIFRSNYALIGIPLTESLFGEAGIMTATLLSIAVVPTLNILAVLSLSIFREGGKINIKKILLDIVKNPLIQSIFLGIAVLVVRAFFVSAGVSFRLSDIAPIYKVLTSLSGLATPMALLALGAQFKFSAVAQLKKEIIAGTVMRTAVVPILGIGIAYIFFRDTFSGAHFATFVAVFCTPTAVSSVPMTQEMDGDVILAGQYVVWTTLVSAATVFLASFFLRFVGIF